MENQQVRDNSGVLFKEAEKKGISFGDALKSTSLAIGAVVAAAGWSGAQWSGARRR